MINRKAGTQLVIGGVCFLFLGLAYAWSVFVVPLEMEFSWSRTETSAIFTISMIFFYAGNISSGFVGRRVPGWMIMIACALLYGIGFFCAARVSALWQLYLAYGVCCGFATGIGYNNILRNVTAFFPTRTGLATGTLLMGFGFGSMLLGSILRYLIDTLGWRRAFLILCVTYLAVITAAAFLLKAPDTTDPSLPCRSVPIRDYTAKAMIRDPRFGIFYIWLIITTSVGLAVFGHASACAQEAGASTALAGAAAGALSLANGIGRVLFGIVYDKRGRHFTMMVLDIGYLVALCILLVGILLEKLVLLTVGLAACGFVYGGLVPCMSAYTKQVYGAQNYGSNFSLVLSSGIAASVIGPLAVGYLRTVTGSYLSAFLFILVLSMLGFLAERIHVRRDRAQEACQLPNMIEKRLY